MSATSDGTVRIEVVAGGEPTPEQLAALAVALTPATVPDEAAALSATGWMRATLHEGVGARVVTCPADIEQV